MSAAAVNRLVKNVHDINPGDCGLVSLSTYLNVSYTDIIRIAARVQEDGGKNGLHLAAMKRIAELCGSPLKVKRNFDPDEDYGIVWIWRKRSRIAHAAVLRNGLVLDRDTVWEWLDWVADQTPKPKGKGKPPRMYTTLYVVKE